MKTNAHGGYAQLLVVIDLELPRNAHSSWPSDAQQGTPPSPYPRQSHDKAPAPNEFSQDKTTTTTPNIPVDGHKQAHGYYK